MRVMTGGAGEPGIFGSLPAAALLQTIRLKADAANPQSFFIENDIHCGPMAGAAEINRVCRREMGGVQNGFARFVHLACFYSVDVVRARPMAGFTMDSGDGICEVEAGIDRRSGGVAGKAPLGILDRQAHSKRSLKRAFLSVRMPGSYIDAMSRGEAAYLTLVQLTIAFKKIGLAMNTGAESPTDF